jgi:hypothetical protein
MSTEKKTVSFAFSPKLASINPVVPAPVNPVIKQKDAAVVIPNPFGIQHAIGADGKPIQFVWVPQQGQWQPLGQPAKQQQQQQQQQQGFQGDFQQWWWIDPANGQLKTGFNPAAIQQPLQFQQQQQHQQQMWWNPTLQQWQQWAWNHTLQQWQLWSWNSLLHQWQLTTNPAAGVNPGQQPQPPPPPQQQQQQQQQIFTTVKATDKEVRRIPLDVIEKGRMQYKEHKCSTIKDTKADELEKFLRGELRRAKNISSSMQNELNDKERELEEADQKFKKLYGKLSITLQKVYYPGKGEW